MRLVQLIEYNKRSIFRLALDLLLFFFKKLNEVKTSGLQLSFNIF